MSDTLMITRARADEYPEVRDFYYSLTDALEGTEYHPEWRKDVYPSQEDLLSAAESGTLYVGRVGGRIAGAMVVNQSCNEAYQKVNWPAVRDQKDFVVIHMLGVHRDFCGKGYAKEMVKYALNLSREVGMKAVRLDVLEGNIPAERLYSGLGFSYAGMVPMFYEDTGWKNFKAYEYVL